MVAPCFYKQSPFRFQTSWSLNTANSDVYSFIGMCLYLFIINSEMNFVPRCWRRRWRQSRYLLSRIFEIAFNILKMYLGSIDSEHVTIFKLSWLLAYPFHLGGKRNSIDVWYVRILLWCCMKPMFLDDEGPTKVTEYTYTYELPTNETKIGL